jgi:hypothetical protein
MIHFLFWKSISARVRACGESSCGMERFEDSEGKKWSATHIFFLRAS